VLAFSEFQLWIVFGNNFPGLPSRTRQTSRSIRGLDRRQVAFVNQRHITEDKLNEAITTVINGYNEFSLPKIWGVVTENSVRAGNAKILSACRHSLPEKLIEGTIQ
jgi:Tn3 transposase DDE domain